MTNEELRVLDELLKAHRQSKQKKITKRRRKLAQYLALLILIALIAAQGASALYVSELSLLQPRGLDSVTNSNLLDAFYPVGAIYQTTANINPDDIFGGVWKQIDAGRTLVGAGAGFTAGDKGGSADTTASSATLTGTVTGIGGTVSLTGTVSAAGANTALSGTASGIGGAFAFHFSHYLSIAQMPAHTHYVPSHTHTLNHSHPYAGPANTSGWPNGSNDTSVLGSDAHSYWTGNGSADTTNNGTGNGLTAPWSGNTGLTGSGSPINFTNTGTASGLSGSSSATISAAGWAGDASASGTVSDLSGNVSVPSGTLPDKTMQPYIVVYIWERIA